MYFFYSKIKLFQTILKMFLKTIYHSWIKFILHVYEEEEAKAENNIQLNTMVMYMKKYELVLNINKKLLKRRWVIESVNDRWTFVLLQRSLCVANFRMSFLFVYVVFFHICCFTFFVSIRIRNVCVVGSCSTFLFHSLPVPICLIISFYCWT